MASRRRIKGVILAAGRGTRLRPLTDVTNKILLPVFDRPMIAYPIETLKSLGVRDICIVTSKEHLEGFMNFLGDGSAFDVKFTYVIQDRALGISHAMLQAEDFFKGAKVVVTLGDNIFEKVSVPGRALTDDKAYIFLKEVKNPQRFGVAEMDRRGNVIATEEKPKRPKTHQAITGLYIYPRDVFDVIRTIKPSQRGEYEITDVINHYIGTRSMKALSLGGYWLDTGTFESLLKASVLRAVSVNPKMMKGIDRRALLKILTSI